MIQAKLLDGSIIEVAREDAFEFLPYENLFSSPVLRAPVEALFCHRGKIIPVLGPMPSAELLTKAQEQRPWLLLLKGYAQVIQGFPIFADENAKQSATTFSIEADGPEKFLNQIDELMKTA